MSSSAKASVKTREKTGNSSSHAGKTNVPALINSPIDEIFFLQRTVGNREVERLLKSGVIQAKLTIGRAGDVYEQQADRVSEQVMSMPPPHLQRAYRDAGLHTRRQTGQPGREHERLQTKHLGSGGLEQTAVPPIVNEVLRSPGQPLDPATLAFIEPRFGHDFSQVRVHADAKAAESTELVNALAYTVGRHVVFGEGQPAPATSAGRQLLAHELAHVVQQRGATPLCPSQFKRAGHEAAAQEGTPPLRSSEHSTRLQRQPKPKVSGDDPWERHKDIPKELHPVTGTSDVMTLVEILFLIGEAVRIRHDFQTALEVTAPQGPRRLSKTVTWESEFAKGYGPGQPTLSELAYEHYYIETGAHYRIALLQNTELAEFLSKRIGLLFPDIGFSETGPAQRRLGPGPKGVWDRLSFFSGGADIVRLLLKPAAPDAYYW